MSNGGPGEPMAWADLVLTGGRVLQYVVPGGDPRRALEATAAFASALAVRGVLIVAIGSDDPMAAFTGPDTRVVALDGHLVLPGLIDSQFMVFGPQCATWSTCPTRILTRCSRRSGNASCGRTRVHSYTTRTAFCA